MDDWKRMLRLLPIGLPWFAVGAPIPVKRTTEQPCKKDSKRDLIP